MNREETTEWRGERRAESSHPGVGLGEFLRRSLKKQWRDYRGEFKRCRRKFSEKSVHQLRVSIRRLLSTLGVLASVIPDHDIARAQRALKKRLKAFAKLRDTHTQLRYVEKLRGHSPAAAEYHQALHRRECRLRQGVRRKLPRIKQRRLAESVAAIKEHLRSRAGDPALEEKRFAAVRDALRAAYANVVARDRAIAPADTATIHRTRVAFKNFRYMMEALQPLLPGVDQRQLKSMHGYQARMGDIQDLVVLLGSVDKFVKKHHRKGEGWRPFRADLVRRRAALIERFLAARDALFEFYSFKSSPFSSQSILDRSTT